MASWSHLVLLCYNLARAKYSLRTRTATGGGRVARTVCADRGKPRGSRRCVSLTDVEGTLPSAVKPFGKILALPPDGPRRQLDRAGEFARLHESVNGRFGQPGPPLDLSDPKYS